MGIVLLIVLQLSAAVGWLAYREGKQAPRDVDDWEQIPELTSEERELQENLAMWYNLNLANFGEGEPTESYGDVFYLEDGLMCSIEFFQGEAVLPVWHGAREKQDWGFTHLSRSSLPLGGKGNHTVLTGGEDVIEAMQFPERGDRFSVCVLGERFTYRIFDVKTTKRDPSAPEFEEERDLCSIWIRRDAGWVIIRGVRETSTVK